MMIAFSVLSFASLSVATLAWFTSNATATFTATELRVDPGLIYTFYAYNGNFKDRNPANEVTGYSSATPSGTFSANFTAITEDNQGKCTTFNKMWPGQKLTFAIHLQNVTTGYISVNMESFTSTYDSASQVKMPEVVGLKTVDMAWTIDLYGTSSETSGDFIPFIEDETLDGTLTDVLDIAVGTDVDSTLRNTPRTIAENDSVSGHELYVFYTVMFSNDPETYLARTDSTFENIDPMSTTDTHYYIPHPTLGDSNAYIGLSFHINQLTIREVE